MKRLFEGEAYRLRYKNAFCQKMPKINYVTIQSIEFLSTTENTEFTEVNFKYENIRKS
ncbi:MAG: hypothetical protein LBJ00_14790 [Planctomycetaceae bacterium]|nr:hypothetical protein [Planctomycetaceae bacterium]